MKYHVIISASGFFRKNNKPDDWDPLEKGSFFKKDVSFLYSSPIVEYWEVTWIIRPPRHLPCCYSRLMPTHLYVQTIKRTITIIINLFSILNDLYPNPLTHEYRPEFQFNRLRFFWPSFPPPPPPSVQKVNSNKTREEEEEKKTSQTVECLNNDRR